MKFVARLYVNPYPEKSSRFIVPFDVAMEAENFLNAIQEMNTWLEQRTEAGRIHIPLSPTETNFPAASLVGCEIVPADKIRHGLRPSPY